jgi:hypothetical protein
MVLARRAAIAVPTVNARIPKLTVLERERERREKSMIRT